MKRSSAYIAFIFLFGVLSYNSAFATVYFYWDAESHPCDGTNLPNPPFWTQEASHRGHVTCGETPNGNRFIEFVTGRLQKSAYTEIGKTQGLPVSNPMNKTFYLAYFFNFTRINGIDIWHENGDSADKGVELVGNGIRWLISRGHWGNLGNNQDHAYTVWGGNPSYHLNSSVENYDIYRPNQGGYGPDTPIQLEYEKWYSVVMALKVASSNTGYFSAWINGRKILEYKNIKTAANNSPTIEQIRFGGTIAQPSYDAPAHKRQFDALILTDDWEDIVNGGYVHFGPPNAPTGLIISQNNHCH